MNQVEMIKELSKRVGITQAQAMKALKEVVAIVRGEIQAEGKMHIADLGIFTLRERKAIECFPVQGRQGLFQMEVPDSLLNEREVAEG